MNIRDFVVFKLGCFIPDKIWISIKYFQWFKKLPDLNAPKTFNEKLNWLKLYDRNPEYTKMVDKFEAKKWISDRIGKEYVAPVLGGPWNSFDEIDFEKLPNQFVLKTTHDCGGVVICKDKATFDKDSARIFLNMHLNKNYYLTCREWPYKNVLPRIFAEEYMSDLENSSELTDYKFLCFDGIPKAMYIATDRVNENEETKFDFFDMEYNHLPFTQGHPNAKVIPQKPESFEKMKELAGVLSKGFPQIRVDFYNVKGKPYVGELTLFHLSGNVPFNPAKWDEIFGEWIKLPQRS